MALNTVTAMIKQRTMNALRGSSAAEFGVIAAKGISHVEELASRRAAAAGTFLAMVQATLGVLLAQLRSLDAATDELERPILANHLRDPVIRLAASVPGVRRARRFGDSGQRARSARPSNPAAISPPWLGADAQTELDRRQRKNSRVDNQAGQSRYIRRLLVCW